MFDESPKPRIALHLPPLFVFTPRSRFENKATRSRPRIHRNRGAIKTRSDRMAFCGRLRWTPMADRLGFFRHWRRVVKS
jgi:hypothetical protein